MPGPAQLVDATGKLYVDSSGLVQEVAGSTSGCVCCGSTPPCCTPGKFYVGNAGDYIEISGTFTTDYTVYNCCSGTTKASITSSYSGSATVHVPMSDWTSGSRCIVTSSPTIVVDVTKNLSQYNCAGAVTRTFDSNSSLIVSSTDVFIGGGAGVGSATLVGGFGLPSSFTSSGSGSGTVIETFTFGACNGQVFSRFSYSYSWTVTNVYPCPSTEFAL